MLNKTSSPKKSSNVNKPVFLNKTQPSDGNSYKRWFKFFNITITVLMLIGVAILFSSSIFDLPRGVSQLVSGILSFIIVIFFMVQILFILITTIRILFFLITDKSKISQHQLGKKILTSFLSLLYMILLFVVTNTFVYYFVPNDLDQALHKPVIYLYPEATQPVTVKLDLNGQLTTTYPLQTNDEWSVVAQPDGTLTDTTDGRMHKYLFWEGTANLETDLSTGFVVARDDLIPFLQNTLDKMNLTESEANDFITYWLPHLQQSPYNLIHFAGEEYTDVAKLSIQPQPDSIQRVFMIYKPISQPVVVKEQEIQPFKRVGFTVIEWGGLQVR